MRFSSQLARLFFIKPHRVIIALFWLIQGKKQRAKNRLRLILTPEMQYQLWLNQHANSEDVDSHPAKYNINDELRALIQINFLVCCCDDDGRTLVSSHQGIENQTHKKWRFFNKETTDLAQFDYVVWVKQSDQLPEYALAELENHILAEGESDDKNKPDVIYSDHDYVYKRRREHPYFKGGWNPILLEHSDYIMGLCSVKVSLLGEKPFETWQDRYDLLRALSVNQDINVKHISCILYHVFKKRSGLPSCDDLQGVITNKVDYQKGHLGLYFKKPQSIDYRKKHAPFVSILIPTRDMLSFLKPCVDSVLSETVFPNYEILILNNDSVKPETLAYFKKLAVRKNIRILDYAGTFNYSAINNFGVKHAKGDYVCLLNNDTKIISSNWLTNMMAWACQPNIGAVGAKLLYADESIQHAGVQIGLGHLAGHGHRYLRNKKSGYFFQAHLPQQVMAVTAACLLVNKNKFIKVGGLDEKNFTVAFNDVDLCLKLDRSNYRNIYEPRAVLYHYESKSRGKDIKGVKKQRYMSEVKTLRQRWNTDTQLDRFYNENLTCEREDFSLKMETRSR
jgi:GT2 family glycosyltransferase